MNRLFRLWAGRSIDPARILLPGHISHHIICRADERYRFLLGADIADFGGTLFCGWGNSRRDENDRWSVMRGCRSGDGGRSWGAAERISPPLSRGFSSSHGVFFPCGGRLHALVPQARYGIPGDSAYPGLRTVLMTLAPDGSAWQFSGVVIPEPFWPMARPQKSAAGNYLLPGIRCIGDKALPAVAVSDGERIDCWRIVEIPQPRRAGAWGEGGLLVDGSQVAFVFRNGWKDRPFARIAFSGDSGESWSETADTNLPMSPAKPCCGTLSDGRRYLIFNPAPDARDTLAVAVSAPGELQFRSICAIRHGKSPRPRFRGWGKECQWAYPSACEYNGALHIVYASSKEDCVLSVIPLDELK